MSEQLFRDSMSTGEVDDTVFAAAKKSFCQAAALRAINLVFPGPSMIDRPAFLYDISTAKGSLKSAEGELSGWLIEVANTNEMIAQIRSVIVHFNADVDVLKLYLFKIGDNTPVWEGEAKAENGRFTVNELSDCYISYRNEKATKFFFGYKPSELPPGTMFYDDQLVYMNCFSVINAVAIKVTELPGYDNNYHYTGNGSGLNLEFYSMWDNTDAIIRGASCFDELIGLCGVQMLMESALFSSRLNGSERAIKENSDRFALQMDLTGTMPVSDAPQTQGLRARINMVAAAVRGSFTRQKGAVV